MKPSDVRFFVFSVLLAILLVVIIGQDSDGDLYWYHYHNGWSWWNDRLSLDVAPAGFPSWYNPYMDALFYGLYQYIHPVVYAGLLLGLLQVLAVVPVFYSVRMLFPASDLRSSRLVVLAGIFGPGWIMEAGTTNGDATTVVLTATAVCLVMSGIIRVGQSKIPILIFLGGISAGLATGLKLTNGITSIALVVALALTVSWKKYPRLLMPLVFGEIAGFLLTGGYWIWQMWTMFGNPFFPQFAKTFPNLLTLDSTINVARFTPTTLPDSLIWPITFALHPERAGSVVPVPLLLWLVILPLLVYVLVFHVMFRKLPQPVSAERKFLFWFVLIGFASWEYVFSVFRYLIQIEVFLPAFGVVVLSVIRDETQALKFFRPIFKLSVFLSLIIALSRSGSARWTENLFDFSSNMQSTHQSVIVFTQPLLGYLAAGFPNDNVVVQIDPYFSHTSKYEDMLRQRLASHNTAFVIEDAQSDWRASHVEKANEVLASFGMLDSSSSCRILQNLFGNLHTHAEFHWDNHATHKCRLTETPQDRQEYHSSGKDDPSRWLANDNNRLESLLGYHIDYSSCTMEKVRNGTKENIYYMCKISKLGFK